MMNDIQEELPPLNKSDSTAKFIDLLTSFTSGMAECYPDCPQINGTNAKVKLVCSTELAVGVLIDKWFDYLQTPLPPNVKYARAVERILQKRKEPFPACTTYHAFAYGDVNAALEGENPIEEYIDLNSKMSDPTFDQESKDAALKYVRALNDCVCECIKGVTPYCPSRSELADEIKLHKESKKPSHNGRLSDAMGSALSTLATEAESEGGDPDLIKGIAMGSNNNDWISEWHIAMLQTTSNGTTLYDACTNNEFDSLQYADPSGVLGKLKIHALLNHSDTDKRNKCRELVSHINILAQVHTNVPGQMRGKIEAAAEQLAGQIMTGSLDMSSIDLNQIGQDVLDGCDSADLSSLAENIGSLLPILSKGVPPELAQRANPMLQLLNNQ